MHDLLNLALSGLAVPLLALTGAVVGALVIVGLRQPHLARIGLRNMSRRPLRAGLIVFGLMLATMFVAAAFAVDDTITLAVKTIAVFNLGRIDEQVVGGDGPLGLYSYVVAAEVEQSLAGNPHVAGIAPALVVPNLLVADENARQVRGGVVAMGLLTDHAGPLGDLRTLTGASAPAGRLGPQDAYLNRNTAQFINAHVGDTLSIYAALWPGQRYTFRVAGIVAGGPLGDSPQIVLPIETLQTMVGAPEDINQIYIANAGDGLSGAVYSPEIANQVDIATHLQQHTIMAKLNGVNFALNAQSIFGRILTLFTLFAMAIGLLLIFLIFVLLAAERRAELGMARALGMRRSQIVGMLLFEGAAYDGVAAIVGILAGLALGIALVGIVGPTLAQLGFPLRIDIAPASVVVAFCLGFLFTLATMALATWAVTQVSIAAALRDLPDPPARQLGVVWRIRHAWGMRWRQPRAASGTLAAWSSVFMWLTLSGLVPLGVGVWLVRVAVGARDALWFSVGISCALAGVMLALRTLALALVRIMVRRRPPDGALRVTMRATQVADRATALVVGGGLALYWSLPFDALAALGLPRFSSGIQIFFFAGIMMVFGAVWAIAPNFDVVLAPLQSLLELSDKLRHASRIAVLYPMRQRFRTGVGLSLFALVCFTMVVMACIAASTTQGYDNLPQQAAGYDIAGQPLFAPIGGVPQILSALGRGPARGELAATSAATPLPLGIIQPSAPSAGWRLYPVSEVQGAFLDGVGLPLVARALGFASDAAVWQAVRNHPGDVVIDTGALSGGDADALGVRLPASVTFAQFQGPPIGAGLPGLSSLEALDASGATAALTSPALSELAPLASNPFALHDFVLRLRDVARGRSVIAPTTVWVSDLRGGPVRQLTIIGLVNNAGGHLYGLLGSQATFAPVEASLPAFGNEYYYFQVKPGVDAHAAARDIGSTLLSNGFEATVLQDVLLDTNGPRVFISRILVGLVGLTLLVGMAALAVSGSRAVVERRQQIGMLRALGFRRWHVQFIFLLEALLVGLVGTVLGLVLGLILCRNVFAVDFFNQFQSGLVLVIPWRTLTWICGSAILAAMVAALLPAWQAGRVAPADALRYE